jgi:fucose permease
MLAVLVSGMVAGRIDLHQVLFGSVSVVAISVFFTGVAPIFLVYLLTLFVRGVATGPFRALDRAMLSHLYPDGRSRIFNVYALVWAVGAASGPLVVTAALALGNWRFAYLGLALAFLPAVYLVYRLDLPVSLGSEETLRFADLSSVLRQPGIIGMMVALFLSGGIEGSVFTRLPYFATEHLRLEHANLTLTAFLLAYIPGRFLYSVIVERFRYSIDLVLGLSLVALPLLGVLVFVVSGQALFAAAFLLGFVVSGFFPTVSAFGVELAPEFSSPVNALSTAASYSGIATIPVIVGLIASRGSIQRGLALLPVLLVVFIIVVALMRRHFGTTGT